MIALLLFVLFLSLVAFASHRARQPRIEFEVAMEPHQWDDIASFWKSCARLGAQ